MVTKLIKLQTLIQSKWLELRILKAVCNLLTGPWAGHGLLPGAWAPTPRALGAALHTRALNVLLNTLTTNSSPYFRHI